MQSFPFTSQISYDEHGRPVYDRAVDATILRDMWKSFFTNGVFPNPGSNFSVIAGSGMQIKVRAGHAIINGAICYEDQDRVLTVQAAETNDRIDIVVLRLNDDISARKIDLYIVKGTAASTPSAPAPTRLGGIYELVLAQLYVSANSSSITQERITDTRLNTEMCGYVNAIDTVDTTTIFNQFAAWFEKIRSRGESDLNGIIQQYTAEASELLEEMRDILDDSAAGHFQLEIDDINTIVGQQAEAMDSIVNDHNTSIDGINNRLAITTGTLTAGKTSVTIKDDRITTDSALSFYSSIYGINPTAVSVAAGSVTLTFDAQGADMEVGVRVDG